MRELARTDDRPNPARPPGVLGRRSPRPGSPSAGRLARLGCGRARRPPRRAARPQRRWLLRAIDHVVDPGASRRSSARADRHVRGPALTCLPLDGTWAWPAHGLGGAVLALGPGRVDGRARDAALCPLRRSVRRGRRGRRPPPTARVHAVRDRGCRRARRCRGRAAGDLRRAARSVLRQPARRAGRVPERVGRRGLDSRGSRGRACFECRAEGGTSASWNRIASRARSRADGQPGRRARARRRARRAHRVVGSTGALVERWDGGVGARGRWRCLGAHHGGGGSRSSAGDRRRRRRNDRRRHPNARPASSVRLGLWTGDRGGRRRRSRAAVDDVELPVGLLGSSVRRAPRAPSAREWGRQLPPVVARASRGGEPRFATRTASTWRRSPSSARSGWCSSSPSSPSRSARPSGGEEMPLARPRPPDSRFSRSTPGSTGTGRCPW